MYSNYKENVFIESILKTRVEKGLFEGYYGGIVNEDKTKFYAATLVRIADIDYNDFDYLHSPLGYSCSLHDFERTKKYNPSGSWEYKSITECIEEGILLYFSMLFIGVLFEGEWFILKQLSFYGDQEEEKELKKHIEALSSVEDCWNRDVFQPEEPNVMNFGTKRLVLEHPEHEEFSKMPLIVSMIKRERKEKVNRAFVYYFHEEFILPFFQHLKMAAPAHFVELRQFSATYPMIFPVHKKYLIVCAAVKGISEQWELKYFAFIRDENRFYDWTYFKNKTIDVHSTWDELIIEDLKQISNWSTAGFLRSDSCTMDHENFWEEYVLKKDESGGYLFLKEIGF